MDADTVVVVAVALIPLAALWAVALFHIIARRPDLAAHWKAIWSVAVIALPFIGVLVYALVRPASPPSAAGPGDRGVTRSALHELRGLVAEHEAGRLTDREYTHKKAAVFGLHTSNG